MNTDNKKEILIPEEFMNWLNESVDKYAFQVPYDGSNKFYDENALKDYKAGAIGAYRHLHTQSVARPHWVKCLDRMPILPNPLPTDTPEERGVLFVNRKHSAAQFWFPSYGYTAEAQFPLETDVDRKLYDVGWGREHWEWLDESPSLSPLKEVEKEEEKAFPEHIHVKLPCGAVVNVSPDAPPELLQALDKMADLAAKSLPIEEKEVPYPFKCNRYDDGITDERCNEQCEFCAYPYEPVTILSLQAQLSTAVNKANEMSAAYYDLHQELSFANARIADQEKQISGMRKDANGMCAEIKHLEKLLQEKQEWINSHL